MAYHIICERLIKGDPVIVFGDGSQTRSNTYVDDAVDATLKMIHHSPIGQAANVAGGDTVSLLEAVRILSEVLDVEPALIFEPERPGDQMHTHGDYRLATELLLYSPRVPIRDGLERQAKWHQSSLH
jgi:nucleoside-diphosphate-sugar epimerase